MTSRRRFLTITAWTGLGAALAPGAMAAAPTLHRWRGSALGAAASIVIAHDDAHRLTALAKAEVARLEGAFSLYRPDSALSRLNAAGILRHPPPEMLELLAMCDALHARTDGAFDPTVQPLWALYAERHAAGTSPSQREISTVLHRVGWRHVDVASDAVALRRPGAKLTLNGIAQGYISDKVAALLKAQGVDNVLVDIGETVAVGNRPDGQPWRIGLADPARPGAAARYRRLSDQACATSAPAGTSFDHDGRVGHILDPRSGRPGGRWRQVSVIADSAAYADGLSTAFCLMETAAIRRASASVEVVLTA